MNLLIIGCTRDEILKKNISHIKSLFSEKDLKFFLYSTKKDFSHPEISDYIFNDKGMITSEDVLPQPGKFDHIIVCQSYDNMNSYFNVFDFLVNNGINEVIIIDINNLTKKRKLKKFKKYREILKRYFGLYRWLDK